MILYALTIFTSAFLLFLVQPIMAKQVLPWFGGSAAVWTTCLVFFQFLLLFGYAYTDVTTRKMTPRNQLILHAVLLIASLISLPIIPDVSWKPAGNEDPTYRILGLLAFTIGLPYFLLSTTGPLVQAWFARAHASGTVYRLFALSNFASLLALISYPFAVEPWVTTRIQSFGWSAGYVLFVIVCICAGVYSLRAHTEAQTNPNAQETNDGPTPAFAHYGLWLLLSAMGSFILLAVTNHITHDVASVPFLWLLPLTIYLITFILCFEGRGWYKRIYFLGPLMVVVCALAWFLHEEGGIMEFKVAVPLFSAGLFVMCMFFHGELAAMKPAPRYLTTFYLMVSLGGALGGVVVGFIAPRFFNTYYEFGIGLVITLLLAAWFAIGSVRIVPMALLVATGFTGYHVYHYIHALSNDARLMTRNFYGTLRVKDTGPDTSETAMRRLMHGVIMHGEQYLNPAKSNRVTTYYTETSGVGLAVKYFQQGGAIRVGVIGLGTGTLAAYGREGDVTRFYEINPQVIDIARRDFKFISDSKGQVDTVLGDARLTLERETPQQYDVLAIDAFSSDAIPVHLITKEAMAIYLKHIKPDGVMAFHVTNRFLKLAPVVKQIADTYGLQTALISDDETGGDASRTDWVLVTRNKKLLQHEMFKENTSEITDIPGLRLWTDDFNNLVQILK
ncbi:MAG TPA: fused MFS/spermidine synthase [Burkholderiales bacterium]|nr:fused MFS/spermidine synthase [Burkholderiales bacterium]